MSASIPAVPAPHGPGEAADYFLQRVRARDREWAAMKGFFRDHAPDAAALARILAVGEVAVTQVFAAYRVEGDEQDRLFSTVKDYVECAALYGWALGQQMAHQGQGGQS